jgi:DNA repair protein RAD51
MSFAKDATKPIGSFVFVQLPLDSFQFVLGGNIIAHASTTRLKFKKGRGDNRICQVSLRSFLMELCVNLFEGV